jgi:hypothetical protein
MTKKNARKDFALFKGRMSASKENRQREKLDEIRAEVARNEAHRKALWDSAIEEKHKNNEAAIWGLVGLLVIILIGILSEM